MGDNIGGRAYLVAELRKAGLSERESVRILKRVLDAIKGALERGEEVEFPLGNLRRKRLWGEEHWIEIDHRPGRRQPYTVAWEWNAAAERLLNPEPGSAGAAAKPPQAGK